MQQGATKRLEKLLYCEGSARPWSARVAAHGGTQLLHAVRGLHLRRGRRLERDGQDQVVLQVGAGLGQVQR